jgi:VanZ family protein
MTARARAAALGALALAWAGFLFWVSAQPNPFPFVPRSFFTHDKLAHAGAYAVLGALVLGASARARTAWRGIALAAFVSTAYGATDEWHQSHVPNREADPGDLAADAAGAIAGAAAAAVILRGRMSRASIRG